MSVTCRYYIETDKDIFTLFLGLVAPPLWFSIAIYDCEILTERGACHLGGLRFFFHRKAFNNDSAGE